ncbi:hypothetical protein [Natrarchaeobius chitinivorans]|nr:hypothetical protein [Natrarchaeobius chitinivorans]
MTAVRGNGNESGIDVTLTAVREYTGGTDQSFEFVLEYRAGPQ